MQQMTTCRGSLLILTLVTLGACTTTDLRNAVPFVPRPTTTQEMNVSEVPALAYERSVQTILAMGGSVLTAQPETYRIFAVLEGAVALNVVITPTETGSLLSASQKVSGDRIAYLPVRVCEQFFAAYKR